MPLPDDLIFSKVSDWAGRVAEGFVSGRLPAEDTFVVRDLLSRFMWNAEHPDAQVDLPHLDQLTPRPPTGRLITAGPYRDAYAEPISPEVSKLLGLPLASKTPQVAQVIFTDSKVPVQVLRIPTCTDKGVFDHRAEDKHPPHPVIQFGKPVGHVHVRMSDAKAEVLWDATYDLKGGRLLDDRINSAIPGESLVPDYVPACSVGKTVMKLSIDAEDASTPMEIKFMNPNPPTSDALIVKPKPPVGKIEVRHEPMLDVEKADAVICKITKKTELDSDFTPVNSRSSVTLPSKYAEALWRLDRSREESSDRNPHGLPMMETSRVETPSIRRSDTDNAPSGVSVGSKSIFYLPRRPELGGEIQVDQLEKGNFFVFDARKMPTEIQFVDSTAHQGSHGGFAQPTVERTAYSPMWQGYHSTAAVKDLHPSISLRHTANAARVVLKDLTDHRVLWNAVFNVKGAHKIAADQDPVDGSVKKFIGINPAPNKPHLYKISVDVDNPNLKVPNSEDRMINFWRHSDFLFAASRPVDHADVAVAVGPKTGGFASLFRS